LENFRALTFTFADFAPPSAEWDHDPCEGCGANVAWFDAPEILRSGHFTIVDLFNESAEESEMIQQARQSGCNALAKQDTKQWGCPECFQAFRATFGGKLKSKPQN
jgi:hypothetical protein